MLEKKSFFGSKLINLDNSIFIENQNIVYYQTAQNEQLNFKAEQLLSPIVYNANDDKQNNSSLTINQFQNNSWILTINYGTILTNYLFATLKYYRTFEGVTNNITINNDINSSIYDYINKNILNRYQYSTTSLYISYNNLIYGGLQYQNNWNPAIELDTNLMNQMNVKNDSINNIITITFTHIHLIIIIIYILLKFKSFHKCHII